MEIPAARIRTDRRKQFCIGKTSVMPAAAKAGYGFLNDFNKDEDNFIHAHQAPSLPDNIWINIFSFLKLKDVVTNCRRVSRFWYRLSFDAALWKIISISDFFSSESKGDVSLVSDAVASQLVQHNCRVRLADFKNCTLISNRFLLNLALQSSHLQHLNIDGVIRVSDRGINALAKSCSRLESINIMNTLVTDRGLCNLIRTNTSLREITASTYAVSSATIDTIVNHAKELWLLHVDQNRPNAVLKRKSVDKLTSDMIVTLAGNCPDLQILIMKYSVVRLSDVAFQYLAKNCLRLQCVEFGVLDWNSGISNAALVDLCSSLGHLQYLDLFDTDATDVTLETISKCCPRMKHLSLDNCRGFNDMGVLALMDKCKELESLSLGSGWEGRLSNISVFAVAKSVCAANLIKLSMRFWEINDFGLLLLSANTPNLQHLSIEGCLYVSANGLKQAMQHWPNLVSLDISFTSCISKDEQLDDLASSLKSLQMLIAYECDGVSIVALCKLKGRIPQCSIESDKITL